MQEDDRDLVERARRGDGAAVGALFSRYWRAARAAAFGVTGEIAAAEDAAAEAFRQAWAGLDSLRDPGRFGPWLRTIVVRNARLARHGHRSMPDARPEDLPDDGERPDDGLERLELAALVQRLVRTLPPRLREAVSLFYFEGYGTDDAARFLDIPPGTFRRRLHESRQALHHTAHRALKGHVTMNDERARQIERLTRMMERDDDNDSERLFQLFRESLTLRPVPHELIAPIIRRQAEAVGSALTSSAGAAGNAPSVDDLRSLARLFASPSDRAFDSTHPVGAVAARIRRSLPDVQEWKVDAGQAAAHLLAGSGPERDRGYIVLPPGFSEGRPGAFIRATRAILLPDGKGSLRTTYQQLQSSTDTQAFAAAMNDARISDVLDITWMVAGRLELRAVQALLERVGNAVLPETPIRFVGYDEPRYRAALQLRLGDLSVPAANGGALAEWPGRPQDVDAAHVRIFLEPWAAVDSGQVVECDRLPKGPWTAAGLPRG